MKSPCRKQFSGCTLFQSPAEVSPPSTDMILSSFRCLSCLTARPTRFPVQRSSSTSKWCQYSPVDPITSCGRSSSELGRSKTPLHQLQCR